VLIMGGGYDTAQDTSNGAWVSLDTVGNQVFMVDAVSGNRLWYASNGTSGNLDLDDMDHSIPADVRVIDITGDGLADRMYAADMGGRIWRFDIFNGEPAATLVAGGVFASLGNAHESTHPTATTRRFYNAPDVALLSSGRHTWINIAIGSGYRGHPLNTGIEDRFYSLRDHMPLRRLTQSEYEDTDVFTTITHDTDSLTDVTAFVDGAPVAVEPGAAGWYLDLKQGGSWTGEKVLSEARTVANMIQFPTWEPSSGEVTELACEQPAAGLNRLYSVSAFDAAPVIEQNSAAGLTEGDRSKALEQSGIAPEVVWLFPSPDNPEDCVGAECRPPPRCLIGVEKCPGDITFNMTRTFWTQNSVN
jgi:type IV pilus assembly protein PilY1